MSDVEKLIGRWRTGWANSQVLANTEIRELENHLREEVERLKSSGLSDDEAFLVARHRLGDATALEEEFGKVNPHRPLITRLYWMGSGALVYLALFYACQLAAQASALLGYATGLRGVLLTLVTALAQIALFAVIVAFALRHQVRRALAHGRPGSASLSVRAGVLLAGTIVALFYADRFGAILLQRTMSMRGFHELVMAQAWATFSWNMLMPFLLAGAIALLVLRGRQTAEVQ